MMKSECFSRGDRRDAPNVAILITDGEPFPESRRGESIREAQIARDEGREREDREREEVVKLKPSRD